MKNFYERQYLGSNKLFIMVRLFIALFCFVGYYWSENPKPVVTMIGNIRIGSYPAQDIPNSGEAFFLLGMILLMISLILLFIPHLTIASDEKGLIISKFFSKKKIHHPFS